MLGSDKYVMNSVAQLNLAMCVTMCLVSYYRVRLTKT